MTSHHCSVRLVCVLCCLLSTLPTGSAQQKSYQGHQLFLFRPKDQHSVDQLTTMLEKMTELDPWVQPAVGLTSPVVVPPQLTHNVSLNARDLDLDYTVVNQNLGDLIDGERLSGMRSRSLTVDLDDHSRYRTYDEITDYIRQMESKYQNLVSVREMLSKTYEKQTVYFVRVSSQDRDSHTTKPVVVLEAGIHAREWISPASGLAFLYRLVRDFDTGEEYAKQLLGKFDWYLIPVVNPDGYRYTHTNDRLWRKNRTNYTDLGEDCFGVDLNRNFDIDFGVVGTSSKCKSEIYGGPHAFSEPEARNIKNLTGKLKKQLAFYVSLHSYGQFILRPWGFDTNRAYGDETQLINAFQRMVEAMSHAHQKNYVFGTAKKLIGYSVSGSSEDWVYSQKKSIVAGTVELRPSISDSVGFVLPPGNITLVADELRAGLVALVTESSSWASSITSAIAKLPITSDIATLPITSDIATLPPTSGFGEKTGNLTNNSGTTLTVQNVALALTLTVNLIMISE